MPGVQLPRVGGVTLRRPPVLSAILATARLALTALVVLMMVVAAAVATGRTEIPLQALAAVRSPDAFPAAPAAPPPVRSVAAAPVLKVGTVMNLPLSGVATDARVRSAAVVEDIERAAAAARAAERRAAARAAAQKAAAEKAAAQRLAAQRAAEAAQQAAAERAAEQAAARRAAAKQAAAEEAAAGRAAARRAAARQAQQAAVGDSGQAANSGPGSSGEG